MHQADFSEQANVFSLAPPDNLPHSMIDLYQTIIF